MNDLDWAEQQAERARLEAERTDSFGKWVEAVAAELDGFEAGTMRNNPGAHVLCALGGRLVYLHLHTYGASNRRVSVSGRYPSRDGAVYTGPREWGVIRYDEKAPEITVSLDRSPQAAAKDIARRFLPRYSELYAACVARKAEADERQARRDALALELAERAGVTVRQDLNGAPGLYLKQGTLRVYEDRVSFEGLAVSPEVARRILDILAE